MGTPTLVQHIASGRELAAPLADPTIIFTLPNPAQAGNCLVLGFEIDASYSIDTVTDDKGNIWSLATSVASGQVVYVYYALNVINGTQQVSVALLGSNASSGAGGVLSEFYNVQTAAVGGYPKTATMSSDAAPACTMTLSGAPTSGDLVWMFAADVVTLTPKNTTGYTKGTNFTLLSAQRLAGKIAQYSVTTSSTTVAFTAPGTNAHTGVAIALQSADAGRQCPRLMRIVHAQWENQGLDAGDAGLAMQFPSSGNLLVGVLTSGDQRVSSVEDSQSNAWNMGQYSWSDTQLNPIFAQVFFAPNATPDSDLVLSTFAFTPTTTAETEGSVMLIDITGAASVPLDTSALDTFEHSVGNVTPTSAALTPSRVGGIVFNVVTVFVDTLSQCAADANGHVPTWILARNTGNNNQTSGGTSASRLQEDDGRSFLYVEDTLAVTFSYTLNVQGAAGSCSSVSMAFLSAGQQPPILPTIAPNINWPVLATKVDAL